MPNLGANFLELNKGLHCCLESVHTRYLRMVLGVGSTVDQDVLRAEACSPVCHSHWVTCIFKFWNELSTSEGMMAHEAWKDDIVLMLLGYKRCWCYQYAHKGQGLTRMCVTGTGWKGK